MRMSGYPKGQPGEERVSARLGAGPIFGVQPHGCDSTGLSLLGEVCGVGAFAREKKKIERATAPYHYAKELLKT